MLNICNTQQVPSSYNVTAGGLEQIVCLDQIFTCTEVSFAVSRIRLTTAAEAMLNVVLDKLPDAVAQEYNSVFTLISTCSSCL